MPSMKCEFGKRTSTLWRNLYRIMSFHIILRSNISSQTLCDTLYTDRIAPVMWEDMSFLLVLSSKFLILFPSGNSFNFMNQCLHAWWGSSLHVWGALIIQTKTFLHIFNIPSLSLLILLVTLNIQKYFSVKISYKWAFVFPLSRSCFEHV